MHRSDVCSAPRSRIARPFIMSGALAVMLAISSAFAPPVWALAALWIANNSSNNLEVFGKKQQTITGVAHPGEVATSGSPLGIAFDRKANLWTTIGGTELQEFTKRTLARMQRAPSPSAVVTSTSFEKLVGCNFDRAGNLWIADAAGSIHELSATQLNAGTALVVPAAELTAPGHFVSPQFVAFDKTGNLWVSDEDANAVFEFTPNQLQSGGDEVPRVLNTGLALPGELAFDRKGNLWVANFGAADAAEFSKSSLAGGGSPAPIATIVSRNNILNGAWGLAFDQTNDLWIANYNTGAVMKFGPAQLLMKHPLLPKVFILGAQNFAYQITFGPTP